MSFVVSTTPQEKRMVDIKCQHWHMGIHIVAYKFKTTCIICLSVK